MLLPTNDLDRAVLDLGAVLEGLVDQRFEILLVTREADALADLRVRAPGLPFRVVDGESVADGAAAASFDVVFVAARDGKFDVRQLNHLMDEIDKGADVAVGYRPRRWDGLLRQVQRWGWDVQINLDCAFALVRSGVWRDCGAANWFACAEIVACARRYGFRVREVPVAPRRPTLGAPAAVNSWAA